MVELLAIELLKKQYNRQSSHDPYKYNTVQTHTHTHTHTHYLYTGADTLTLVIESTHYLHHQVWSAEGQWLKGCCENTEKQGVVEGTIPA